VEAAPHSDHGRADRLGRCGGRCHGRARGGWRGRRGPRRGGGCHSRCSRRPRGFGCRLPPGRAPARRSWS